MTKSQGGMRWFSAYLPVGRIVLFGVALTLILEHILDPGGTHLAPPSPGAGAEGIVCEDNGASQCPENNTKKE